MNQRGTMLAAMAWLLVAGMCSVATATEPAVSDSTYEPLLEPANWQAPADEQLVPAPSPVIPPQEQQEQYAIPAPPPLLDSSAPVEETTTALEDNSLTQRRGVQPYGGGHTGDWSWGCGGSPFRTGPGWCDTWEVGCRWDVAVDGLVMTREWTDLAALDAQMRANDLRGTRFGTTDLVPEVEQFDYAPGGRVWMTSKLPCSNWQMHAGYEGIEEWNASLVFPKQVLDVPDFEFPTEPVPLPPAPFAEGTEQRSLHYRSSLHSGELNFVRTCGCDPEWRPYCGVRYVKFDDEINDFYNQEAQPPIAGPRTTDENGIGPVSVTDRLNLFDIENNLIGFQVGLRHDLWRPNRRFAIEGFVNSGVYYNHIKHTNFMGIFTTNEYADNTTTLDFDESRIDFSETANNDVREYSEISYISEASISGVCRLNRCWALRAGYQALWVANVHLADDAYLGNDLEGRSLFFHGWHAGVEHRR
jgi:hypothetical protein